MDIAGYRILRTLARGPSAEFVLGHRAQSDPQVVVIRRPVDIADPHSDRVLAAYAGIQHPHVARLVDVGTDERGAACAILERLPDDLPDLLESRDALTAGEVVTVLAPIVMALGALHDAGIAHGSLSAASIRLRDDGAPVLVGFVAPALFARESPEAVRERVPEVVRDREAMRELAVALLAVIDRPVPMEVAERIRIAPPSRLGPELLGALGMLGPPTAIGHATASAPLQARAIAPVEADDASSVDVVAMGENPVAGSWRIGDLAAVARRIAEPVMRVGPIAVARDALGERWRSLGTGARRLAVAGAVGVAVVAIAVAAVPAPQHPMVTRATAPGAEPTATSDAADPALSGDDPVAAARALLRERDRCIRLAARSCLDAVDQSGSPAAASDHELIAALADGWEMPTSAASGALTLTQRWGDTALIALGPDADPVSLLVMKSETGWRIRSYEPRT